MLVVKRVRKKVDPLQAEWRLVCHTSDDWQSFPTQFEGSKNPSERQLYKVLTNNILPLVLPQVQAKERHRRKLELLQFMPIKRSSRLEEKRKMTDERMKLQHELSEQQRAFMESAAMEEDDASLLGHATSEDDGLRSSRASTAQVDNFSIST